MLDAAIDLVQASPPVRVATLLFVNRRDGTLLVLTRPQQSEEFKLTTPNINTALESLSFDVTVAGCMTFFVIIRQPNSFHAGAIAKLIDSSKTSSQHSSYTLADLQPGEC